MKKTMKLIEYIRPILAQRDAELVGRVEKLDGINIEQRDGTTTVLLDRESIIKIIKGE